MLIQELEQDKYSGFRLSAIHIGIKNRTLHAAYSR
jgi:hypothetical protein